MPYKDAASTNMSFSEELRDELEFSDQDEPVIPLPRTISGRRTMAFGDRSQPTEETVYYVTDERIDNKGKILVLKAVPKSEYSDVIKGSEDAIPPTEAKKVSTPSQLCIVIAVAVIAVAVALVYYNTVNTLQSEVDSLNDDVQNHKKELETIQTFLDGLRRDDGQGHPRKRGDDFKTITTNVSQKMKDIGNTVNGINEMNSYIRNLRIEIEKEVKSEMRQIKRKIKNTEETSLKANAELSKNIRGNVTNLKSDFDAINTNVNSALDDIRKRTDDIKAAHGQLENVVNIISRTDIDLIKEDMKNLKTITTDASQKMKDIDNTVIGINETNSDIRNLLIEIEKEVKSEIRQIKGEIKNTEETSLKANAELSKNIRGNVTNLKSDFDAINTNVNSALDDIGKRTDDIKAAHGQLENVVNLIPKTDIYLIKDDMKNLKTITTDVSRKMKDIDNTVNGINEINSDIRSLLIEIERKVKSEIRQIKCEIKNTEESSLKSNAELSKNIRGNVTTLKSYFYAIITNVNSALDDKGTRTDDIKAAHGQLENVVNLIFRKDIDLIKEDMKNLKTITTDVSQKMKDIGNTVNGINEMNSDIRNLWIEIEKEVKFEIRQIKGEIKNTEETSLKANAELSKNIRGNVTDLKSDFDAINTNVNCALDDIGKRTDDIKAAHGQLENVVNVMSRTDIDLIKEDMKNLKTITTDASQKMKDIDNTVIGINETNSDICNLLIEIEKEVKSEIRQIKGEIKNTEETSLKANAELSKNIRGNVTNIKSDFDAINTNVNSALDDIGKRTDDIKAAHGQLENVVNLISNLSDKQQKLLTDKIAPNTFNKQAISTAIIVIFVMQLGAMAAIYVLCKGQGQGHGVGQSHGVGQEYGMRNNTRRDAHNSAERLNPILNQIPRDAPLERRLCVIHLEGSTMELHKRIVGTVLNGMATPQPGVTDLHVSNNEDILKIPPATVNILFIHFHDRHVILEQPLLALGDHNITTYRAVRQMGGRLAIVYVNDPGSRRLGETDLYNREIPVREKAELHELCDQDCFYSTYNRLTPHQITSLRRFIAKYLERH